MTVDGLLVDHHAFLLLTLFQQKSVNGHPSSLPVPHPPVHPDPSHQQRSQRKKAHDAPYPAQGLFYAGEKDDGEKEQGGQFIPDPQLPGAEPENAALLFPV
jgi:hypothetical protein